MDSFEKSERRREAQRRLWAKRRRIGLLRSRVVAISLIGFALLWGVVFAQMATGNDPVLGPKAAAREARQERDPREAKVVEPEPNPEPEAVAPEPEPEPEIVEAEPEPEPEFFEPEPVETAQS